MWKQFRTELHIHRANFFVTLIAALAGALVGIALCLGMMSTEPGSWFCMGTMLCMIAGLIIPIFAGGFGYGTEFQLALSMGQTRKHFMLSYGLRLLLQTVMVWAVSALVCTLEQQLYTALYPGMENEMPFHFLFSPVIIPIILAADLLAWFIGSLYSTYGKKGMWFFYIIWMFCCLVLPRVFSALPGDGILDQIAFALRSVIVSLPPVTLPILAALILIAMSMGILRMGMKQQVKL